MLHREVIGKTFRLESVFLVQQTFVRKSQWTKRLLLYLRYSIMKLAVQHTWVEAGIESTWSNIQHCMV